MAEPSSALRLRSSAGRGTLAAAVLASGMVFLDSTVVNVALPRLGAELDASVSGLQWTINGYLLTLAAFVLLGGALGDRFGRRRIFLLSVVWFTAASILCGLALRTDWLVAARFLQGAGVPCSPRARWRCSRRASIPTTGRRRSAPGRGCPASPPRSVRSSAAG
ncbi:hypothetical protein GCM10029963_50860 [Micromonospora andamanensis]